MLLWKRQTDRQQTRALCLLVVLAGAPCAASDGVSVLKEALPVNKLRANEATSKANLPQPRPAAPLRTGAETPSSVSGKDRGASDALVPLVPLVPLTATELAGDRATVGPMPPLSNAGSGTATPSPLLMVSDGWNARNAVSQLAPLLDPAPAYARVPGTKPPTSPYPKTTETKSEGPTSAKSTLDSTLESPQKPDWTTEPRSTLKFITPRAYGLMPTSEDGVRDEFDKPELPLNETDSQRVDDDEAAQIDSVDKPVVDPEQNEPAALMPLGSVAGGDEMTPALEEPALEEPALDLEAELEPVDESMDEPRAIEELPADAQPLDEDSDDEKDQELEVRPLLLDVDGSLAGEDQSAAPVRSSVESSTTKRGEPLTADSISVRSGAKQSVGDEPSTGPVPVSPRLINVDQIGPAGDLILAIGMGPERTPIKANTVRLRTPIERTLNYYWNKPENADERTHWGMFHVAMIYDKDTPIIARKTRYNAVAWISGNNSCRNQLLFEEDKRGINVKSGVGLQGHQAQLLAVFGLIDVPAAYPIYVGRNKYSVNDVIKREMADCKSGNELTFTLIGLSHYIDSDSQWTAHDGQDWDFERLIEEELAQPIVGAACGGTHRLMGFSHALRRRRAEGRPITGQWERADSYIKDFVKYTWQLQNRDGSMSTAWFEKAEDNGKVDRKIQTTGHMVEFLLTALPDDQLQSPQMLRSISFLTNTLYQDRNHDWQVGPKGHALRALAMFYRRTFGRPDPWRPISVARHGNSKSR